MFQYIFINTIKTSVRIIPNDQISDLVAMATLTSLLSGNSNSSGARYRGDLIRYNKVGVVYLLIIYPIGKSTAVPLLVM